MCVPSELIWHSFITSVHQELVNWASIYDGAQRDRKHLQRFRPTCAVCALSSMRFLLFVIHKSVSSGVVIFLVIFPLIDIVVIVSVCGILALVVVVFCIKQTECIYLLLSP